ncbi:glycosyltransferase family 2 protein [Natronomonas salina]|uniref:glycosyltransferase family 2 protein n=1 Tax=Natronomonas salina TaxID=1710540 RepID=UPI0015B781EF|nr:glycosyltransferase family 2 protein [Natronomonas salina]QLD88779.1 glycosyltransferase family 2 protein [Natronomonas salina]
MDSPEQSTSQTRESSSSLTDGSESEQRLGPEEHRSNPASVDTSREFQTDDRIIVGIPTYNEEVAIGSVVLNSQQYADEVIVVDDGSTDQTVEIATQAGATVIKHPENKGKGGAIKTLLSHAQNRDLDALVLLDGDGQHVPRDIPDVVEPILQKECDFTIGSRYLDEETTETPLHRRIGQRVLDYLTLGSSGQNLTDTQSGFRAFSPGAVAKMNLRTDGMGVESEMIGEATANNLDIKEVPIDVRYDNIDGQTYSSMQHGLTVAAFITQLIRDRHPMLFFGVPALLMLIAGGGVMTHSAWLYQATGQFHQWRVIISGFTILVGTICLFCGLVLSQVQHMIRGHLN